MRRIVLTGAPPVRMLDITGPLEVFASFSDYKIDIVTPENSSVLHTSQGFPIAGATALRDVTGTIDTLLVVGGPGSENGSYDTRFVEWIAETSKQVRRLGSICTGAFLLAAAGLLDGRQAVTHWAFCDRLAKEFPSVKVQPDPIFLRDGNTYTSAGITAGIDLALAMVEEDHGHKAALLIARMLVMFLVRPGGQSQFSNTLLRQSGASQPLRELQVWILDHLREHLTVERLADQIGMSTRHFARICQQQLGMGPGELVDRLRLEAARELIESSNLGLKEVADACGFQSADAMRRVFLRLLGITAGDYSSRFKRSSRNHQK
jgi:transcriptional regulator GlxA family with amidase domain